MADLTALDDISHVWGQDVDLSLTGDVGRVRRAQRSRQRVFRRLMTNPGDYPMHPAYGAGIPAMVGDVLDLPKIAARIRGNMLLEPSVARAPAPAVSVVEIPDGVTCRINYTSLPDKQPVSLSFDVRG